MNLEVEMILEQALIPGKSYRICYGPGNINNQRIHIRAVVDDVKIVCRRWIRRKKRWWYDVKDFWFFYWLCKEGYLCDLKGKSLYKEKE